MPETLENCKRARQDNKVPVIGTHSENFHCDEVLACFMLKQLPEYENAEIFRSRDSAQLLEKCDIIVDVGAVFDHEKKLYDHHQKGFELTFGALRPDIDETFQVKLSSAGLIYVYYGERVIDNILKKKSIVLTDEQLKRCYKRIYKNFIVEIDGIDNGVPMYEGEPLYEINTGISARVDRLKPSWDQPQLTNDEMDELFKTAMAYVGKEFLDNVLEIGGSWLKARDIVKDALLKAKEIYPTGEILFLEKFCPWKRHLSELEEEYQCVGVPKIVFFERGDGKYTVMGVPISPESFLGRKFLPAPWRGLKDEVLSKTAGIDNLVFVHSTGFIGIAVGYDTALKMAIKSVEWQN